VLPMHQSERCGAKTRKKTPCLSPAMPNGRCRMHGGASPGAPSGSANGNYQHGHYTKAAIADRKQMRDLVRFCNETMNTVEIE
jgi:hypothetical protein